MTGALLEKYICDCCGAENTRMAADGLPSGWCVSIVTVRSAARNGIPDEEAKGEELHSCADCSAHMPPAEQAEAITDILRRSMKKDDK